MTKMELLSPPFSVVHTSIGTMAMMEMDVNQPTPAISLTSRGTLGETYFLNLHMMQPVEWQNAAKKESFMLEAAGKCATYCLMTELKQT